MTTTHKIQNWSSRNAKTKTHKVYSQSFLWYLQLNIVEMYIVGNVYNYYDYIIWL